VYLVTDDAVPSDELLARLDAALEGGIRVVQFRTKAPSARTAIALGEQVRRRCRDHGALFVMNDRADLAIAFDAHAVHVGQDDLPPDVARRVVGPGRLIGLSVSTLPEAEAADAAPAVDYLGFGAIYQTPTKPDAEYAGLDLLRAARRRVRKPIVAIGGISIARAAEVIEAGADAVAVVSALFGAADSRQAARDLLAQVAQARGRAGVG
jgi:thiamine-phosphate diphosphorylase